MPSISYAITACNEHVELDRLLSQLSSSIRDEDEIVVQMDITATDEVKAVVNKYKLMNYFHPLNKDFATFKNNLKGLCTKDYIFQIDADEYLSDTLLINLPPILDLNPDINVFAVSRINTVEGLTQEHINKWGWRVDEKGWVNYPDFQTRIFKNIPELYWVGRVHERIVNNPQGIQALPEGYGLDLIHPKTIERQEKQNNYYSTL
jgi:glycosyltransferase involved in cell wall biosynthesis